MANSKLVVGTVATLVLSSLALPSSLQPATEDEVFPPDLHRPMGKSPMAFRPLCQTSLAQPGLASRCEVGGERVECPHQHFLHAGAKLGATPGATGAWVLTDAYVYFLDRGLASEVATQLAGSSVIEFGAGKGCYSGALIDSENLTSVRAYDGAPGIGTLSHGLVKQADLTADLDLGCASYVMSFEVAEHIPKDKGTVPGRKEKAHLLLYATTLTTFLVYLLPCAHLQRPPFSPISTRTTRTACSSAGRRSTTRSAAATAMSTRSRKHTLCSECRSWGTH